MSPSSPQHANGKFAPVNLPLALAIQGLKSAVVNMNYGMSTLSLIFFNKLTIVVAIGCLETSISAGFEGMIVVSHVILAAHNFESRFQGSHIGKYIFSAIAHTGFLLNCIPRCHHCFSRKQSCPFC